MAESLQPKSLMLRGAPWMRLSILSVSTLFLLMKRSQESSSYRSVERSKAVFFDASQLFWIFVSKTRNNCPKTCSTLCPCKPFSPSLPLCCYCFQAVWVRFWQLRSHAQKWKPWLLCLAVARITRRPQKKTALLFPPDAVVSSTCHWPRRQAKRVPAFHLRTKPPRLYRPACLSKFRSITLLAAVQAKQFLLGLRVVHRDHCI